MEDNLLGEAQPSQPGNQRCVAGCGGRETAVEKACLAQVPSPRAGQSCEAEPGQGTQKQGFASQPAASCHPARPEDRNAVLCSLLSPSLGKSLKVRIVVSVILLSHFSKAQKHYSNSVLRPSASSQRRRVWREETPYISQGTARPPFLILWDPSHHRRRSPQRLQGGWGMGNVPFREGREGTCCQSHFSTNFSCTFISSQDSPLCPDGKGGLRDRPRSGFEDGTPVGLVPQVSLPPAVSEAQ